MHAEAKSEGMGADAVRFLRRVVTLKGDAQVRFLRPFCNFGMQVPCCADARRGCRRVVTLTADARIRPICLCYYSRTRHYFLLVPFGIEKSHFHQMLLVACAMYDVLIFCDLSNLFTGRCQHSAATRCTSLDLDLLYLDCRQGKISMELSD